MRCAGIRPAVSPGAAQEAQVRISRLQFVRAGTAAAGEVRELGEQLREGARMQAAAAVQNAA